jgi:Family of unknown function (DUF6325)
VTVTGTGFVPGAKVYFGTHRSSSVTIISLGVRRGRVGPRSGRGEHDMKGGSVADTILGPVDYLAVEWPGRHVTGEGFRLLMDLVDREIVRVLDLLFIAKDADGNVSTVDVSEVEHSDALDERLWGLSSGLLDQSDIDEVAAAIEPGNLAGILVYENVWAVPMWTALDRSSARLVGAGRIVADDLIAALDAPDPV